VNRRDERLCSAYNGLCGALETFRVENMRDSEGSLVWSFEAVGRNLHYYPALVSGTLRHNDVTASPISFNPLDTDTVPKSFCPAPGG
jgi:hypothetical protein